MIEITAKFPPVLYQWIEQRIADGYYIDAGDYLRDLIRRDLRNEQWLGNSSTASERTAE